MKLVTSRALAAVVAAAVAAPALAQDAPAEPVVTTVSDGYVLSPNNTDWTGGYVGGQVGYGELDDGLEGDDWIGGVQAGYDWDLGDWVVGVGADANFGNIETSAGDLESLSRLKLRGGYDFGNTLLYATTGASYADGEDLGSSWGYFGGLGVEVKATENWSVQTEVSKHWFDDFDGYGNVDAIVGTVGVNYRF